MSTEVTTAAPVPAAESGTEVKSSGNISVEGLKAMLNRETESAPVQAPAEVAEPTPAPAAPVAETPAEALPEGEAKPEGEVEVPAETPEAATDPESDLSQEDAGFDDEAKARISNIVRKRVAKEKAKQAELANQLQLAQQEAAQAKAQAAELVKAVENAKPIPVYTEAANDPLAKVDNLNDLQAEYRNATKVLADAEALLDDGIPEGGVTIGDQTITEAELKAIKRNARRIRDELIPAKAQFLQARQGWQQKATSEFGYLKDRNSPEYVQHMAAYQSLPVLRSLPNADYIIGAVMAYEKSKAAKPAAPVAAKPKAAASQVAASAAPVGRTREAGDVGGKRETEAKRQAILKKGNLTVKDASALFTL